MVVYTGEKSFVASEIYCWLPFASFVVMSEPFSMDTRSRRLRKIAIPIAMRRLVGALA
jgi:hypothetical protein